MLCITSNIKHARAFNSRSLTKKLGFLHIHKYQPQAKWLHQKQFIVQTHFTNHVLIQTTAGPLDGKNY